MAVSLPGPESGPWALLLHIFVFVVIRISAISWGGGGGHCCFLISIGGLRSLGYLTL